MEQKNYDVFISYSRKDYVRDDQVIPGNPITAIQDMFDHNGISYWFDKDGIYSGDEFVKEISSAIVASKMLMFISSKHWIRVYNALKRGENNEILYPCLSGIYEFVIWKNSNVSVYTCGEILKALRAKKLIIPFRIDKSDYNPKFEILLLPLNHIDYLEQPNTALPELLRTVKKEKERIEKIEADSDRSKRIESAKEEIKEKAREYQALAGQQDYILKELYSKNKLIGNTIKRCPVCEKGEPIQSKFCSQCGWHFPKLYGIDGGNVPLHDETQLAIARKCWQGLGSIVTLQKENESLKEKNAKIEKQYRELERKQKFFTVNGVFFKMIRVEGDTFMMGVTNEQGDEACNDEKPVHQVTLSDYSIGETQVTQELWQAVMGSNPSRFEGSNRPVERVSWDDCKGFIRELNKLTGKRFRLPTEAEWEYAARGGKKSNGCKYAGSNDIDAVAWYLGNSGDETHPVGQKQPNELGLYDMSGNVWEWCQDRHCAYSSYAQTNPTGPVRGWTYDVLRGGGWPSGARLCRLSRRGSNAYSISNSYIGLRLACSPSKKQDEWNE